MTELIVNQLTYRTNANTILRLLKSGAAGRPCPPLFSLHSIRPIPAALVMPPSPWLTSLLLVNIAVPPVEENIRQNALTRMLGKSPRRANEAVIRRTIDDVGGRLRATAADASTPAAQQTAPNDLALFDQAVQNYAEHKFFSQYDWCMAYWGTIADIQSVVESTFELPTGLLEFSTLWTPPLAALQDLADMFPSVRFELRYRRESVPEWTLHEIFPVKPWGY
jgi:hypothetical protein